MEVRVNNALLVDPTIEDGWLVYRPAPALFAAGENLVGILAVGGCEGGAALTVERLEVHVAYR